MNRISESFSGIKVSKTTPLGLGYNQRKMGNTMRVKNFMEMNTLGHFSCCVLFMMTLSTLSHSEELSPSNSNKVMKQFNKDLDAANRTRDFKKIKAPAYIPPHKEFDVPQKSLSNEEYERKYPVSGNKTPPNSAGTSTTDQQQKPINTTSPSYTRPSNSSPSRGNVKANEGSFKDGASGEILFGAPAKP